MYFIGLKRMKQVPTALQNELDAFLLEMYKRMHHFTPKTMARSLQITEALAWDMLLEIREAGMIRDVLVTQCDTCRHVHVKAELRACKQCGETENLKKGVYFIVQSL